LKLVRSGKKKGKNREILWKRREAEEDQREKTKFKKEERGSEKVHRREY